MLPIISGFDWDSGNREKCTAHGVSLAEIESVLEGELRVFPDAAHSTRETRFLALGRSAKGRHVFVAFTLRTRGALNLIRPISARYMHAREVRHYEAQVTRAPHSAEDPV